jgi:hypothetical protein
MEMKNFVFKCFLVVAFLSLIVLSGISAWTEPTSIPPSGNIYPPVNTGTSTQYKTGSLGLGDGTGNALVAAGNIWPSSNNAYDLGTSTFIWKNIYFNKGYFTTLDPIYKINDKKYATYVSDMVGLKAEVIGEKEFKGNSLIIDLENQKEGSDLWLFYSIVKKDNIIPFVSSQSPVSLYGYIEGSKFIIKTIGENINNVKFSYRLVGERIDNVAKDNLADDQNISMYTDIDKIK